MLLWTAQLFHILNLKILGDSKAIIDWVSNRTCFQVISPESWKLKVKELLAGFLQVNIKHVWREFNKGADFLSKQASMLDEGKLCLSYLSDGHTIFIHVVTLF